MGDGFELVNLLATDDLNKLAYVDSGPAAAADREALLAAIDRFPEAYHQTDKELAKRPGFAFWEEKSTAVLSAKLKESVMPLVRQAMETLRQCFDNVRESSSLWDVAFENVTDLVEAVHARKEAERTLVCQHVIVTHAAMHARMILNILKMRENQ